MEIVPNLCMKVKHVLHFLHSVIFNLSCVQGHIIIFKCSSIVIIGLNIIWNKKFEKKKGYIAVVTLLLILRHIL